MAGYAFSTPIPCPDVRLSPSATIRGAAAVSLSEDEADETAVADTSANIRPSRNIELS